MYYPYGEKEIRYLQSRDPRLGQIIKKIGYIQREVDEDLFSSVVRQIIGQQISSKAQATIWQRLLSALGTLSPARLASQTPETLRPLGIPKRKAHYLLEFTAKVLAGQIDLQALATLPDAEAIASLSQLSGIGVWTAEMLLIFCLKRPDILSFKDLGIQRGMRMVYALPKIDRARFETIRQRLSPYGSVASFYFWEVSGGACQLQDPAKPQSP
ncbi:MAG: DNA-3-methyladenine glycosylase 2 family protein [Desulfovibrio sp.]|nr:DNA-3-methyladenine glycosylase 2 family protein [Desulfovibrio sp.]